MPYCQAQAAFVQEPHFQVHEQAEEASDQVEEPGQAEAACFLGSQAPEKQ